MQSKYDFLIVGAGFFGATFAYQAKQTGKRCLVIDRNTFIGGHAYTKVQDGIMLHMCGPHIFHTNNERVWAFANRFADFNNFVYRPKVNHQNKIYSFPINLLTLYQIWGVSNPQEAQARLTKERINIPNPKNLEEWALSQVGKTIYDTFIKGYTTKQWGRDPKSLPTSIIKRVPIRLNFDDNYFYDPHQGVPTQGYTQFITNMLDGIEVRLGIDYFKDQSEWHQLAKHVVFTGPIDRFFDYKHGRLEYRSLRFEWETLPVSDFQGGAAINYTDQDVPFTRITEHKHFAPVDTTHTIITREYSTAFGIKDDPYYPINDSINQARLQQYQQEAAQYPHIIFGGRLAEYKYYNMDQVILSALNKSDEILKTNVHIKPNFAELSNVS